MVSGPNEVKNNGNKPQGVDQVSYTDHQDICTEIHILSCIVD